MADKDKGYFTKEGEGRIGTVLTPEDAEKAHHLATADPERDGLMTGPAHEEKYGLERAERSAELWRAAGVHPTENRRLRPGDEGYQDPADLIEVVDGSVTTENTAAPRASRSK